MEVAICPGVILLSLETVCVPTGRLRHTDQVPVPNVFLQMGAGISLKKEDVITSGVIYFVEHTLPLPEGRVTL